MSEMFSSTILEFIVEEKCYEVNQQTIRVSKISSKKQKDTAIPFK